MDFSRPERVRGDGLSLMEPLEEALLEIKNAADRENAA
jgi:hypothetical protein